ncbi:NAD-dependent epimerase [Limibacter armeniacum]|uniref:NAD-dependent epimerase n=1 Tax=Limibacter armeniacum TaxID=466084 RepID=UPI002FE5FB59
MRVLVTGAAGFIGFYLCKKLLALGFKVYGIDNVNNYYDPQLKYDRLARLGIQQQEAKMFGKHCISKHLGSNMQFMRMNLEDRQAIAELFEKEKFDYVCHLGAQAGVRYSLENPHTYVDSNIVGFLNVLEECRHHQVKHFVYASSSSVYGMNDEMPFSTDQGVDHPVSLYAATKRSNELMAHTYSHLYNLPTTGLRFFTVYGPWGRPDMAIFLFTKAIVEGKSIKVFNNGNMERDFTYVDDIVDGVIKAMHNIPAKEVKEVGSPAASSAPFRLYNIGNNKPVKLMDFVDAIEKSLGVKAIKEMLPIQAGDVEKTWADVTDLMEETGYQPSTDIIKGVKSFTDWYLSYYSVREVATYVR